MTKGVEEEITSNKKIDMYKDPREGTSDMPDTIITCLQFLEAVEDDKYGFRWECPNGGNKCRFRHMLPEGYVITTKKEREEAKKQAEKDKENQADMPEFIMQDDYSESDGNSEVEIEREDSIEEHITKNYLTSDQAFLFSDSFTLLQNNAIIEAAFVFIDDYVYILFADTQAILMRPFKIGEIISMIMSPTQH